MVCGRSRIRFTGRAEGDLGSLAERGPDGPSAALETRRRTIADGPWTWLRQVHGADVVVVTAPGEHAGAEADAAVTAHPDAVLAILTADCAPVAFTSPEGVRGVAHAGWKGLADGVLGAAVRAIRDLGATRVEATVGPCIGAACYEFSPADLDDVARRLGDHVRGVTANGAPALDLPRAVRHELESSGVDRVVFDGGCTACGTDDAGAPRWFSHRARRDEARQALVSWVH